MRADTPPNPDNLADNASDALAEELRFIAEWESGTFPIPATIVRARQIYRAHPWVIGR